MTSVGSSSHRSDTGQGAGAPPTAPSGESATLPADFRDHMVRVTARMVSRGHAERFDAVVWANEAARTAWVAATDMPEGALLVEEAVERVRGTDRTTALLVMEKRAGTWRFVLADAAGHAQPATDAVCAACHREAPRDFVFRFERGAEPF
jgi:hypothetical protein